MNHKIINKKSIFFFVVLGIFAWLAFTSLTSSVEKVVKPKIAGEILEVIPFGNEKVAICSDINLSFSAYQLRHSILGWRNVSSIYATGNPGLESLGVMRSSSDNRSYLLLGKVPDYAKSISYKNKQANINYKHGYFYMTIEDDDSRFNHKDFVINYGIDGYASFESGDRQETALTDMVELSFKPLELQAMTEEKPKVNWKLIKSMPFGAVDNEPVTLFIYQETDNSLFKAQLSYKGRTYTLIGDVSNRVLEGKTDELKNGLVQQPSYLLQHKFGDKGNKACLLGGVELFANGPGQVAYLVYDLKHNKWLQFEEWGIPYLEDLDSDHDKELVVQFAGLHMQFPDVRIIRWYDEQLEESEDFKNALGITAFQPSTVYLKRDNGLYFSVEVRASGSSDLVNLAKVSYRYENGKLIKD